MADASAAAPGLLTMLLPFAVMFVIFYVLVFRPQSKARKEVETMLKNLKKYDVIEKIPVSVGSRKVYLDIEEKMKGFSKKVKIPMDEMDLLFWSIQTGFIFK